MFTGIVEEVGTVSFVEPRPTGARLSIDCRDVLTDVQPGSSLAVNGCCLTAVELSAGRFHADLAPETLARTNLAGLTAGSLVNLERPLAAAGRFHGHVVQGHVDGVAEVLGLDLLGEENWWLRIVLPSGLTRYVVEKGSIALDGISLTVAEINGAEMAATIIPHTYRNTALRQARPGSRLNVEVDLMAKYVEKLTAQAYSRGA